MIRTKNIVDYSIISFGLFPVIPNKFKGLLIGFLFLSGLFFYFKNKNNKAYLKPFLIHSALFFLYIISLIYSSDLHYAFKRLGPGLSIIIFPFIFFVLLSNFKINRTLIFRLLNLFSLSTILFLIIYYIYLFFAPHPGNPALDFPSTYFFRRSLMHMPLWGKHPVFLSIFIVVSIFNLFRILKFSYQNKIHFLILIIFQFLFVITLFLLSGKAAIIFLIITGITILYIHTKKVLQTILISTLMVSLLLLSVSTIPQLRTRFKELFKEQTYSTKELDYRNSSQIRISIWNTAIEKIKEAPVFGYGIGDVRTVLNMSYEQNFPLLVEKNHNSHNQYLGIWLSTGLIGLLFFLNFLFFNFNLALKNKDYLFLAILIFFSLHFLTENIIERQTGAMLFFFLVNLFASYNFRTLLKL